MNDFGRIRGNVEITVSGIGTERFINICKNKGINLYNVRYHKEKCLADIVMSAADFKKIRPAKRASRTKIKIIRKTGLPFWIFKHRKRYFFAAGVVIFIAVNLIMSHRLWRVDIDGCRYYSEDTIEEFIGNLGVKPGIKTSDISCYQIESGLRKQFDRITWVSASVDGSQLTVNIRENEDVFREMETAAPNDIVAGTPIVKIGDEVKAGDVLVMSRVESLNESDECFNVRYVDADADVKISCSVDYDDSVSREYDKKVYTGREKRRKAVRIGDKLINYDIPRQKEFEQYDVFTEYDRLSFLAKLEMPVTYVYVTCREYKFEKAQRTDDDIASILNENMQNYINNLQEKGIQTISNSVRITMGEDGGTASGRIELLDCRTEKMPPVIKEENNTRGTE